MRDRPPNDARRSDARPADRDYRAFVGDTRTYDLFGHMQFSLMTLLGLRQEHRLLDIGCGSLRAGKLFIVYLQPGGYFGIEPEQWLVEAGLERELGRELAAARRPRFRYSADFPCAAFGVTFDFAIAQSIFSHASRAQIERCLSQVRESLALDGIFAASFDEGDDDYGGADWVYPGIVKYRAETITKLAAAHGLDARRVEWFHSGGQTWFVFTFPGRDVAVEALASMNQVSPLREELAYYKRRSRRLERIEAHPVFRLLARARGLLRLR